jgi:hypothetical protein
MILLVLIFYIVPDFMNVKVSSLKDKNGFCYVVCNAGGRICCTVLFAFTMLPCCGTERRGGLQM